MCNNNSINSDEKSSVLIDKTKSGKIRPWREKKMANVDYFELLHILEFKKAERVKDCAEVLEYKVSYETGEKTRSEERRVGKGSRKRMGRPQRREQKYRTDRDREMKINRELTRTRQIGRD